jgi:hypothetical protein
MKPGPAQRVDPGLGGWTGPSKVKNRLAQKNDQTRSTWRVNP